MNGYLVIGVFTVILAVTLYWLQGRQTKKEAPEPKRAPIKTIEVVKARDWPVQDDESEKELEPEPIAEKPNGVIVEETETAVEPVLEEEPEVEEYAPEPEVTDITHLSGVGPKYRSLLREAGITTINQVVESEPEALLKLLHDTNDVAGITKRPPTMKNVKSWIESAKAQLL